MTMASRLHTRLGLFCSRVLSLLYLTSFGALVRHVERPRGVRRGTAYGGWWFEPAETLAEGLVVSAGAGEDISFDVCMAAEFRSQVLIVDPTPGAVAHVEAVLARVGMPAQVALQPGGRQDPQAYDLEQVRPGQIQMLPFALWNDDCEVLFYPPRHANHVSYSIDNWRSDSLPIGEQNLPLRVTGRRLSTLLTAAELSSIQIIKLDIEGAEIEVIQDILDAGIRPPQVLVEFDQLQRPNASHLARVRRAFLMLSQSGYKLNRREGFNYSFRHS
jgi:FkbM family methyltransferase